MARSKETLYSPPMGMGCSPTLCQGAQPFLIPGSPMARQSLQPQEVSLEVLEGGEVVSLVAQFSLLELEHS